MLYKILLIVVMQQQHPEKQAVMHMLIVLMALLRILTLASLLPHLVPLHAMVYVVQEDLHVMILQAKVSKESSIHIL